MPCYLAVGLRLDAYWAARIFTFPYLAYLCSIVSHCTVSSCILHVVDIIYWPYLLVPNLQLCHGWTLPPRFITRAYFQFVFCSWLLLCASHCTSVSPCSYIFLRVLPRVGFLLGLTVSPIIEAAGFCDFPSRVFCSLYSAWAELQITFAWTNWFM